MPLAVGLPLVSLPLLWLLCRRRLGCWRASILASALIWQSLVVVFTEGLSLFRLLRFWPLTLAWLATNLVLVKLVQRGGGWPRRPFKLSMPLLGWRWRVLLGGLALELSLLGVIGLIAPPNNYDSQSYHLVRIEHWIQDSSLATYPTNIDRQLYLGPGAELALLQVRLLSGGDQLVALIQWLALLAGLVGCSLIARRLGASGQGQLLSALVAGTLPMAVLQGSSTQNDLVEALWLVCLVWLCLRRPWQIEGERSWPVAIGVCLGLALLTKGTGFLFGAPVMLWVCHACLSRLGRAAWRPLILIAAVAIVFNLPSWARNQTVFGSPLGPPSAVSDYRNAADSLISPLALLSNLLRNTALHLATPSQAANDRVVESVTRLHQAIGLDVDDPRTTYSGQRFWLPRLYFQEDHDGNPIHFLLIVGCVGVVLLDRRFRREPIPRLYLALLAAMFLLFCWFLRWQPWHSRLQLPLFVLASPVVASVLIRRLPGWATAACAATLLLGALPWVLFNQNRPLLGADSIFTVSRAAQYYAARPVYRDAYLDALAGIERSDCTQLGLLLHGDGMEYPLWAGLRAAGQKPYELEHVNVGNTSRSFGDGNRSGRFEPCLLFVSVPDLPASVPTSTGDFARSWSRGSIGLYLRQRARQQPYDPDQAGEGE